MIISSPHPDVAIPATPLAAFVLEHALEFGDAPALVDAASGRTITYAELDGQVRRVAAGLRARGLRRGDVVAIFSPNLPEYAAAFHGVAHAGGTNTTPNVLYTAEELAFQLRDSGARFLITIPPFVDRATEAAALSSVEEIFVFGEAEGATPFATLLDTPDDGVVPAIDVDEHLVTLPYSSGTTGLPKGVMLTHRNLVANICQFGWMQPLSRDDTVIAILPFFHIYGQTVILNAALRRGARIVTMAKFDLEEFLRTCQDQRVTVAYVAPPVVLALAKHPLVDRYDLGPLRLMTSGAAPLDAELQAAAATRLGCRVIQGYGLSETSPVTHSFAASDEDAFGWVGPLLPSTTARLVSVETSEDAAPGEPGEVWIAGPQVMKGYLNNTEATTVTITADGWLRTGDIGIVDERGYFKIVDRLKELIKYKGYQVPPAELEGILLTHPSIADACVIPVADEEAGEIPKAFVVVRAGAEITPDEVMAYVAGRVAPHKKVRLCELIDAIPKSASGKILRRVLVERERALRA